VTREPVVVRAYSKLIRLYPRSFRDEYGADMVQLVRDQSGDEAPWQVCGRAAIDLAITIPTQHLEARMNRTPNHLVPLVYTALAASGALLAVVGGTNATMLAIGACITVTAAALAAIAWRRAGPFRSTDRSGAWWKLMIAGPCIIATVIVAAGLGVEAWYLGLVSVFIAFILTGLGLLLGLIRLVSRRTPTLPT
jgi:hypothetical protein